MIQFAVEALKVKHIMVVGHYGCGGVKAALQKDRVGLVDIWLRHVRDVHAKHEKAVDALPKRTGMTGCANSMCWSRQRVCQTFVVRDAWARGQPLTVHAWIYGLKDGLMVDLGLPSAILTPSCLATPRRSKRWVPEYCKGDCFAE